MDGQWKVVRKVLASTVIPRFIGRRWKKRGLNGWGADNCQEKEIGNVSGANMEKSGEVGKERGVKCSVRSGRRVWSAGMWGEEEAN